MLFSRRRRTSGLGLSQCQSKAVFCGFDVSQVDYFVCFSNNNVQSSVLTVLLLFVFIICIVFIYLFIFNCFAYGVLRADVDSEAQAHFFVLCTDTFNMATY